jgi:signal transduction histidine kinase
VPYAHSEDILVDFAHELRQPLSALEALTSYLDLITTREDTRVQEQLRRMHLEIDHADEILRDGLRTLRAYLSAQGRSVLVGNSPVAPPEAVVDEMARPLTNATMAPVTY